MISEDRSQKSDDRGCSGEEAVRRALPALLGLQAAAVLDRSHGLDPAQGANRSRILSSVFCLLTSGKGFTLMELVMVIVIISILAVSAWMAMPRTDLKLAAAVADFRQAARHAHHLAMTREYKGATAAWGISVSGNRYTIRRADGSENAEPEYVNQPLSGGIAISSGAVWFNGLGEPIAASGAPLATDTTFTIGQSRTVIIHAQTGYAE